MDSILKETPTKVWVVMLESYDADELETFVADILDFEPTQKDLTQIALEYLEDDNKSFDENRNLNDWYESNSLSVQSRTIMSRK